MVCIKCNEALADGSLFCNHCGKKQVVPSPYARRRGNGQGTAQRRGKSWTAVAIVGWKWDSSNTHLVPIKRTKGGFKTKGDALQHIATLKNEAPRKKITLEDFYKIWSENSMPKLSASKRTAYEIAHRKATAVLYCDIKTLTIGQLQNLINEKAPTFYPAKDMKTLLSHLFGMAVAQQEMTVNLAEYIELPSLDEKEQQPFTTQEQNALWEDYAAGNVFTGYILLMIYTGMMPGELFVLRKDMIDFEAHTIIGCGKKTKKRKETPLVISDVIDPVLRALCENTKGEKLLRMNKDNFYKVFKETLARCKCRQLPPYSCRHTTATALALRDIPLSVVQEVMRHTKITTTQRYIHVDVSPMLEAVNKLQGGAGDAPSK